MKQLITLLLGAFVFSTFASNYQSTGSVRHYNMLTVYKQLNSAHGQLTKIETLFNYDPHAHTLKKVLFVSTTFIDSKRISTTIAPQNRLLKTQLTEFTPPKITTLNAFDSEPYSANISQQSTNFSAMPPAPDEQEIHTEPFSAGLYEANNVRQNNLLLNQYLSPRKPGEVMF
ncbi:hypothetical protein [Flavobacterium sp. W21_SRS_FM6]|uniref:hypothetical protein n=1 Tax=Flavobacterium sp. W21_SRS_FM6 TaxID=3240268 RepID=UPI003F92F238